MSADDDGFVSPRKILRMTGAGDDDLKVLLAKGFVIPFKTGVIVITHWKQNNYLRQRPVHPVRSTRPNESNSHVSKASTHLDTVGIPIGRPFGYPGR